MNLIDILIKLISYKTITGDYQASAACLHWVKEQIQGLPLFTQDFEQNGFPSLIITTKQTKTPLLWLAAHLDVVPGSPAVFEAETKAGGRLYGRGAFDMKFAAACYIKLLKELGADLKNYDLGVMLTTDEEIGGLNGVGHLVKEGYSSKLVFLPDGGKNWQIEKAAKGVWHALVESRGVSAHGSRPWLGRNAIDQLMNFVNAARKFFPKEPCSRKNHYHSTLNVGVIEGGRAVNQVPDSASARLDIRFISDRDQQKIKKKAGSAEKKI